jgi:hypothetical protein
VSTIIQLADVVKFGAASLGANNPEAQVCAYYQLIIIYLLSIYDMFYVI